MRRIGRKVAHWALDHYIWDLFMRLLESAKWKSLVSFMIAIAISLAEWVHLRTWPETIAVGLFSFGGLFAIFSSFRRNIGFNKAGRGEVVEAVVSTQSAARPLEIVSVESPLGWQIVEGTQPERVKVTDLGIEGCVMITASGRLAMDHLLGSAGRVCKGIHFTVKLPPGSLVYAGVTLRDLVSGEQLKDYWLTFSIGDPKAKPRPDARYEKEVNVPVSGSNKGGGWIELNLSMEEQVVRAFGDRGLGFSELVKIRLRNSLSISPIWIV